MRIAHVTEIARRLEPVGQDTFVDDLRVVVVRPAVSAAGGAGSTRPRE